MLLRYKHFILGVIKPYSSILFLNSYYSGFFLLIITFINPSVAISGIFAVLFTIAFAKLIGFSEGYILKGFYVYNSLLVGMGIGFIFAPSIISITLIAISSIFTFMLSFMLNRLFSSYKIPILSLPFSIVTMFVYLASLKYSGMMTSIINNATVFDVELPLIISGFLKSLGSIFFLNSNIAGILILSLLFYYSRIVFVMALVGYYFGVVVHSYFISSFQQAIADPYAFNYILVSIALCGVFLLPSIKNFFLALIGIAVSVVLTDAMAILFHYYSIPVFTIPFNLTVISFIFILSVIYYEQFNLDIKATPELSLSNYLSKTFRFGSSYSKIALPFTGSWSVYQGFNSSWTHQGDYRYAYDFIKVKNGRSYIGQEGILKNYYAFSQSIVSPVSGYVVASRDDLPDNPIGQFDQINNWGNHIIIKSDLGFYVEISHLMQNSLQVHTGDYIQAQSIIAKCGNSGYSPQPHIHIQVQNYGIVGAATIKFCFSKYIVDNKIVFNSIPKESQEINAIVNNKSISSRLYFVLDESFNYDVFIDDKYKEKTSFKVAMNELGETYFKDSANNQLYFFKDSEQFYFYNYQGENSYLKQLFILAPRIPLIGSNQPLTFSDYLPVYLIKSKFEQIMIELVSIIDHKFYKQKFNYSFDGSCIKSEKGSVCLGNEDKGITTIEYNNIKLKRTIE